MKNTSQKITPIIISLITLFALFLSSISLAGDYDCSLVYDEYDSLMHKQFLLNPSSYVDTVEGRLSRNDYNRKQKGIFLQKDEHKNYGVAIVHTNNNTWGKLMFTWGAPFNNGHPSLILKEVTLYGRVMDGYAPRVMRDIQIASSWTYDLDTGNGSNAGKTADIWFHNVDGNTMYIEAVNGAELSFPMESICQ